MYNDYTSNNGQLKQDPNIQPNNGLSNSVDSGVQRPIQDPSQTYTAGIQQQQQSPDIPYESISTQSQPIYNSGFQQQQQQSPDIPYENISTPTQSQPIDTSQTDQEQKQEENYTKNHDNGTFGMGYFKTKRQKLGPNF